ncbi:hypothetical protein COBT_001727 [Conglomerata obtusa]
MFGLNLDEADYEFNEELFDDKEYTATEISENIHSKFQKVYNLIYLSRLILACSINKHIEFTNTGKQRRFTLYSKYNLTYLMDYFEVSEDYKEQIYIANVRFYEKNLENKLYKLKNADDENPNKLTEIKSLHIETDGPIPIAIAEVDAFLCKFLSENKEQESENKRLDPEKIKMIEILITKLMGYDDVEYYHKHFTGSEEALLKEIENKKKSYIEGLMENLLATELTVKPYIRQKQEWNKYTGLEIDSNLVAKLIEYFINKHIDVNFRPYEDDPEYLNNILVRHLMIEDACKEFSRSFFEKLHLICSN